MKEIWKSIPAWKGMYKASNLGNVRSLGRVVIRSNGRPCTIKERILKPTLNSCGYRCVTLQSLGMKTTLPIYQLVMAAFRGVTPEDLEILHGLKGKLNDCLNNLSFGTHQQNCLDTLRDGLPSAKPVVRLDGVAFLSINRAAKYVGVNVSQLSKAIHNHWKCKGYYWRFENG